jgi:hypothetical protein
MERRPPIFQQKCIKAAAKSKITRITCFSKDGVKSRWRKRKEDYGEERKIVDI